MTRWVLVGILAASGACSLFAPRFDCDDTDWEPGQTCERVLAAARGELPPAAEIGSLTAWQGIYCPPFGGCPFTPFVVTVSANLTDGRQVIVMVDLEDGGLWAQPAEVVEAEP